MKPGLYKNRFRNKTY